MLGVADGSGGTDCRSPKLSDIHFSLRLLTEPSYFACSSQTLLAVSLDAPVTLGLSGLFFLASPKLLR